MTCILNGIKENKRCRELYLNSLRSSQLEAMIRQLRDFLRDNETINTIQLQKRSLFMNLSAFKYFCDSLKQNKTLENLNIENNFLFDIGRRKLDVIEELLEVIRD